jgi:predicted phage terminase large subunit-like protein
VPDFAALSLLDLVPALSPQFGRPHHLRAWCDIIERAANGEAVRALCSVPIRHWKTQTTEHGVVRILLRDPTTPIIHLSHSFERAQAIGKQIRDLAREAGVGPKRGQDTISDWRNEHGGGVVVMSAEQSKLGYDCGVLIFDDPIDEFGAEDPRVRDAVDNTIAHYTARCMRRGKPGPVLGVMSRWHPDDPIGRRLLRTAVHWEYVHHAAIIDEGLPTERAFAPEVWPLEALKAMREEWKENDPTERGWWAQLMNDPRAASGDLFGAATRYTELPKWGYRTIHGADFAFSAGDGNDWFALFTARVYGRRAYVTDCQRHKIDARLIESTCKAAMNKHGQAPIFTYQSGPEIGMSNILIERGVPIVPMHARYSKLVRAERTIKRWNDGDVLVPEDSAAAWVPGFLSRVGMFRGRDKDANDDEIDAMVSACDGGVGGAVAGVKTLGVPRFA